MITFKEMYVYNCKCFLYTYIYIALAILFEMALYSFFLATNLQCFQIMAEALLNYFNTDKPREESIDSEPLKDKEEITVINISLQQNNMITTETISNSTINIIGPSLNQSGKL